MSLLHEAYTALLTGLTYRTGNEIHWQDEENNPIAIEPIDVENERYIVRYYYPNGQKHLEVECQNGQRHGKFSGWYENGKKHLGAKYKNNYFHGKYLRWYKNGKKYYSIEYKNGKIHGKYLMWNDKGKKILEEEWENNDIIRIIIP
jgi:antitoxin component YwqK of YwqJK toxin-antitoxin module